MLLNLRKYIERTGTYSKGRFIYIRGQARRDDKTQNWNLEISLSLHNYRSEDTTVLHEVMDFFLLKNICNKRH